MVDAAGYEGRDPVEDIDVINKELAAYSPEVASRPQIIAANKLDLMPKEEADEITAKLRAEFEKDGIEVYPISAATGSGVKELLYAVDNLLSSMPRETVVFEQEYFPEEELLLNDDPYTVTYDSEEDEYVIEGPKIEKMLGYTNLESEKGFAFFQKFLKESGILEQLEKLGIEEGDTVRMYGHSFDYYK